MSIAYDACHADMYICDFEKSWYNRDMNFSSLPPTKPGIYMARTVGWKHDPDKGFGDREIHGYHIYHHTVVEIKKGNNGLAVLLLGYSETEMDLSRADLFGDWEWAKIEFPTDRPSAGPVLRYQERWAMPKID